MQQRSSGPSNWYHRALFSSSCSVLPSSPHNHVVLCLFSASSPISTQLPYPPPFLPPTSSRSPRSLSSALPHRTSPAMAFPRKYQKVPLSQRDGDEDVQLTALRSKRVETAADDLQLVQLDDAEADSKQPITPQSAEKRYAVISNACNQIIRHKRLPVGQRTPSHSPPAAASDEPWPIPAVVLISIDCWCRTALSHGLSPQTGTAVCQWLPAQDQRADAAVHA